MKGVEYPANAAEKMANSFKKKFKPTLVISIGTAGTAFGEKISMLLGVPHKQIQIKIQPKQSGIIGQLTHRERKLVTPLKGRISPDQRVLIVDDNAKKGLTLKTAKMHLIQMGANPRNIKTVVYRTSISAWPSFAVERQTPFFAKWRRRKRMVK